VGVVSIFDGADVSHYQGTSFPWSWTVAQGCRLGATKATQGTSYVDPTLTINRLAMKAAGLRWRGFYHWVMPGPVAAQAAWFRRNVGALEPGEFIQLDCENTPQRLTVAEILGAWQQFELLYPGRVCVYSGANYNRWQFAPEGAHVPWWLAWYSSGTWEHLKATNPSVFPRDPVVWQWAGGASGVTVPGVGRVDSNQVLDAAALDRLCQIITTPPPSPVSALVAATQEDTVLVVANSTTPGPWRAVLQGGVLVMVGEAGIRAMDKDHLNLLPAGNDIDHPAMLTAAQLAAFPTVTG
jgi:GH25 family lysozyme M1 (1,4-beta-N-acetylmuramidase)